MAQMSFFLAWGFIKTYIMSSQVERYPRTRKLSVVKCNITEQILADYMLLLPSVSSLKIYCTFNVSGRFLFHPSLAVNPSVQTLILSRNSNVASAGPLIPQMRGDEPRAMDVGFTAPSLIYPAMQFLSLSNTK